MIIFVEEKNVLGKTINTVFANILRYDLNEDDCVVRYELRYRDPNRESVAIPDTTLGNGEWKVPTNVLNAWSGSNYYLAEQMCLNLGFTPYSGSLG
jgi:hypothetical protein